MIILWKRLSVANAITTRQLRKDKCWSGKPVLTWCAADKTRVWSIFKLYPDLFFSSRGGLTLAVPGQASSKNPPDTSSTLNRKSSLSSRSLTNRQEGEEYRTGMDFQRVQSLFSSFLQEAFESKFHLRIAEKRPAPSMRAKFVAWIHQLSLRRHYPMLR